MASPAFTSLDALKAYLSKKDSDTTDDALLTRLIAAASQWFETQTNRKLLSADYTDTRLGNCGRMIVPANYPVKSITSVTVDGETIPEAAGPTDYGWYLVEGTVYFRNYRLPETALVELSYTAGLDSVPADVEQAVIEIAADRYKYKDRIGAMSKSIAGETVSFVAFTVPASVQTVIDAYRRLSV